MPDQFSSLPEDAAAPAARERESALRFYGDEFVFDAVSGMFFRLSPTGAFVLRCLAAGKKPGDLAGALQARFNIDRSTAIRDVELFLNELAALEPLDHFIHEEKSSA